MNKIKPKIVDGEPICSWHRGDNSCKATYCAWYAIAVSMGVCVPGLREQRDLALEREKKLQRELCEEMAPTADQYPHEMAKDRDWKCYDTE